MSGLWGAISALLKDTYFGNSANASLLVQNELSRFEQRGLTIQQFKEIIERKIVLANALMNPSERISDREKMAYFVNGLRPVLKARVLQENNIDFSDAYKCALRAQSADQAISQGQRHQTNGKSFVPNTVKPKRMGAHFKQTSDATRKSPSIKKYCSYHKSDKHSSEECRVLNNKSKVPTAATDDMDIGLIDDMTRPTIHAKTGNKNYESYLLMDTGSKYSFISSRIISHATKRAITPCSTTFYSVNNRKIPISGCITLFVNIPSLQLTKAAEFYVVDKLPHPVILGMNGMHLFHVSIDCANQTITNGRVTIPFAKSTMEQMKDISPVDTATQDDFEQALDHIDASITPKESIGIQLVLRKTKLKHLHNQKKFAPIAKHYAQIFTNKQGNITTETFSLQFAEIP